MPPSRRRHRPGTRPAVPVPFTVCLYRGTRPASDLVANADDCQGANPGARIPRGRSAGSLTIAVDTREKYGWKFSDRALVIERRTLPAGDYAAIVGEAVVAAIERKTLENLATSLSDGSLAFQLQRLAELRKAAIVVEADYPDLFRTQPGRGSWLADMLGRLAVRYPEVPVIFAGSRKFAEEWAYRFLGAAVADHTEPS